MIILLHGPDSYRRTKKQQEIVSVYKKKHTSPVMEKFDLRLAEDFEKLKTFSVNQSMFEPVKLAVIEGAFTPHKKTDKKDVVKLLKNNLHEKETILILSEEKSPPAAFKFLKDKSVTEQQFTALTGAKLKLLLDQELERLKFSLSQETKNTLLNTYAEDSWGLVTELEKISLMKNPVVETTTFSHSYFQLINVLKSKTNSPAQKLSALERILSEHREDPGRVFNSLAYKTNSPEEGELLADYDIAIKSGKLDYEEVLVDFVVN